MLLSLNDILTKHNLSRAGFEEARIEQFVLEEIYDHHESRRPDLERAGALLAREIASIPGVHDVAFRVKTGDGLVAKIIRKRRADPAREFTLETYAREVTDLIGVRAMRLEHRGWRPIHASLVDALRHRNPPEANVAAWDPTDVAEWFADAQLEVRHSEAGYRSIHYVVEVPNSGGSLLAEVQLRTMYENSWGEVDHERRYPSREVDEQTKERLVALSRLTGDADALTSEIYGHAAQGEERETPFAVRERLTVPRLSTGTDTPAPGYELIERALARAEDHNVHRSIVDLTADEPTIEVILAGQWYPEDQLEIRFDFAEGTPGEAARARILELFGPGGRSWVEPGEPPSRILRVVPGRLRSDIPALEPLAWLDGDVEVGMRVAENSVYHERHTATGLPAVTVLFSEKMSRGGHPFLRPERMRDLLLELDQAQLYRHHGNDGYAVLVPVPREGVQGRGTYVGMRDIEALVRMRYLRAVPRRLVTNDGESQELVLAFERTEKGERAARRERRRKLPDGDLSVFVLLLARAGATDVEVYFHLGIEEPDPEYLVGGDLGDDDVTRIIKYDDPRDLRCERLLIAPRELPADIGF